MAHDDNSPATLRFEGFYFSEDADDGAPPGCLRCSDVLDYVQPDQADPDRLIGACEGCGIWYLVERSPGTPFVEMLELPRRSKREAPSLATIWPDGLDDGRSCQAGA